MNTTSLTACPEKFLYQCDKLVSAREGRARPAMFFVSLTNRCQLGCSWCLYRDKDRGECLTLDEVMRFMADSEKLGVKTWELTGGGEPLLHPDIDRILDALDGMGFAVGIDTNGLALHEVAHPWRVRWIRVSLHAVGTPLEGKILDGIARIRDKVKTTGAFVVCRENMDRLPGLLKLAERHWLPVKVEPDYYAGFHEALAMRMEAERIIHGHGWVFIDPAVPAQLNSASWQCHMHLMKPFLYTDGWVYSCPCAVGSGRGVEPRFRLCRMEHVVDFYRAPPMALERGCRWCEYAEHNKIASQILNPSRDWEFC